MTLFRLAKYIHQEYDNTDGNRYDTAPIHIIIGATRPARGGRARASVWARCRLGCGAWLWTWLRLRTSLRFGAWS